MKNWTFSIVLIVLLIQGVFGNILGLNSISSSPAMINIIRGPYLQMGSTTTATVKFRLSATSPVVFKYGVDLLSLSNTITVTSSKVDHEITLSSLAASTKYYYQIEIGSSVLFPAASSAYILTHPLSNQNPSIRAWILGDCGTKGTTQRSVRDAYYTHTGSKHTDMVLLLGDNAYDSGTDAEYQTALFQNMYESIFYKSFVWSCLGNHDGYSADSQTETGTYYDIFKFPKNGESGGLSSGTEAYYSFDYGPLHVISLDSYDSNRSVG